jgi:hypothetical protein
VIRGGCGLAMVRGGVEGSRSHSNSIPIWSYLGCFSWGKSLEMESDERGIEKRLRSALRIKSDWERFCLTVYYYTSTLFI